MKRSRRFDNLVALDKSIVGNIKDLLPVMKTPTIGNRVTKSEGKEPSKSKSKKPVTHY